jgi:hypothetical protein
MPDQHDGWVRYTRPRVRVHLSDSMAPHPQRVLFRVLYAAPTLSLLILRLVRHTPAGEKIPETLVGIFGGFFFVLLVGALVIPRILQRGGRNAEAVEWRNAALRGLDLAPIWLFLWPAISTHLWPAAVLGTAVAYVLLVFANRRWRLGIFGA